MKTIRETIFNVECFFKSISLIVYRKSDFINDTNVYPFKLTRHIMLEKFSQDFTLLHFHNMRCETCGAKIGLWSPEVYNECFECGARENIYGKILIVR